MNQRDAQPPAEPYAGTHAEMDALLRQIALLEARLAANDQGSSVSDKSSADVVPNEIASEATTAEIELADLGRWGAYAIAVSAESFASLTEAAVRLCHTARASIWLFSKDRSAIHCEDLFESGPARHSRGSVIRAQALPKYFAALETGEIIDAGDVNTDPRTAEFAGAFLAPLEIGALLDVPVVDGASLAGVLHLEHLGAPRNWSAQERLCAITIATRISLAIRNQERANAQATELRNVELLRIAAETAHILAWEWDPGRGTINWGSNPESLLGPPRDADEHGAGTYPGFDELIVPEDYENLLASARGCLIGGSGFADSFRLRRTDGQIRWILVRGELAKHAGERRLIGVAVDNHEQRQAELQAEQLSRQHRALLDNLPDFAWTKDLEGRYTAVNRAFAASVGKEPGEIIGRSHLDFMPAAVHVQVSAQDQKVIESRKIIRDEGRYLLDNRQGWTEIVKAPIFDRSGNVLGVVGVSHDITVRKEVENRLAQSEKRFRDFAELSADWYWKQDTDHRLIELTASSGSVLPAHASSIGLLRWTIPGIDPGASDWETHKADLDARRPFRDFVYAVVGNDRRRNWARVSGIPLFDAQGCFLGYHGVGRDISAQMRATEELRITQERLELALDGSQICLWDLDLRTGSIYLSEGWSRFYGLDEGPTVTTLDALRANIHPDDVEAVNAAFTGTLKNGNAQYDVEYRCRIRDGSYRWLYSRGKVNARDATGRATRMSGTNLDINDRQAMQEAIRAALRDQESLMDTCPTGLAILKNRMFVRCNPATARFLGYEPGELVGQSTRVMFPDDASWESMATLLYPGGGGNGPFATEIELKRKDGSRVWALLSGHVVDPASNYGIFSIVDITSQRKLTEALAEAKEAADSANRAKSGFLATMSHEIRTPMNGVLGMLELLELGGLEAAQRETVNTIRGQAHALLGLIDDILDFSKIEAGQLAIRPEPMNVATLVEQLRLFYQELASRKNLSFVVGIDASLSPAHIGDSVRIRQIIGNYLSNAIKFTDTGEIRLSVDVLHRDDKVQSLRFCVEDTGIGVSPDDQIKLFQPFVQVDSRTTRRFGGTGLGLSICKRLAEAMGGEVSMQSTPGIGTAMFLNLKLPVTGEADLPVREPSPFTAGWRPVDLKLTKPSRAMLAPVLIAEDHIINLQLIKRQLEILGYKTDTASNGVEALQKWRRNNYSLLITDCHMPDMDGYELAWVIRNTEKEQGVVTPLPIIACTANALAGDAELCLAAGMSDYVSKPVSMATLQAKLAQWLLVEETHSPAQGLTSPAQGLTSPAQGLTSPAQGLTLPARELPIPIPGLFPAPQVSAQPASGGAAPATAAPSPPPLEPRALLEFSGGDLAAEEEILAQFREANAKDSQMLLDALDGRDQGTLRHASHRIKGACRAIGAKPLAEVCEAIEKAANSAAWSSIDAERDVFVEERDRLMEYLAARASSWNAR